MRGLGELRFSTSQELGNAFHALEECPNLESWLTRLDASLPVRQDCRPVAETSATEAALRRAALKLHFDQDEFLAVCHPLPEHHLRAAAEMFHSSVRTVHTRRVSDVQHCLDLLGRCGVLLQVRSNEMQVRQCARQMRQSIQAWQAIPRESASGAPRMQAAGQLLMLTQELEAKGFAVRAGVSALHGSQCLTAIVILRAEEDEACPPQMLMVPRNVAAQPQRAQSETRRPHVPARTAA